MDNVHITKLSPFETGGTASFVGHVFCFTPLHDTNKCEKQVTIREGVSLYAYNPYEHYTEISDVGRQYHGVTTLNPDELEKYDILMKSDTFAKKYREMTGREYLARHPRARPLHHLWAADYFGQTHTVQTRETHFVSLPHPRELKEINAFGNPRVKNSDVSVILT